MPLLLWLDLETTGLDPRHDCILEVAWVLSTLDSFHLGPIQPSSRVLWYPFPAGLSEFIFDMHTRNGLGAECAAAPKPSRDGGDLAQLEEFMLSVVPATEDKDETILAGSSVHFDHEFLKASMPRLAARLSHRHYDVTAVKLFCQSLGMPKLPKGEAHRAAADVLESIDHAKRCAEWLREWGSRG